MLRLCMLHGYFNILFTEQIPASCRNLNQNSPGLGPGTPQEQHMTKNKVVGGWGENHSNFLARGCLSQNME